MPKVSVNPLELGKLIGNAEGGGLTVPANADCTRSGDNTELLAALNNAKFNIIASVNPNYPIVLASTKELASEIEELLARNKFQH